MIVCLCHRISDRDIAQAVRDGVRDFDALQDDTCIARNCGCCESSAREVFEQACAAQPQAPVVTVAQPVHFHRQQPATPARPRHSLVIA